MKAGRDIRVSLVLIPEATAATLLSVHDIFSLYQQVVPGETPYAVTIVGENTMPVTTASKITLQVQAACDEVPVTDIVIVPSLLVPGPTWSSGKYPALIAWLQRQYAQGAVVCSACSGVFPLLEAGLFADEPVTCHWFYEPALQECHRAGADGLYPAHPYRTCQTITGKQRTAGRYHRRRHRLRSPGLLPQAVQAHHHAHSQRLPAEVPHALPSNWLAIPADSTADEVGSGPNGTWCHYCPDPCSFAPFASFASVIEKNVDLAKRAKDAKKSAPLAALV
jgi:putative intracellular protease/amidase